MTEDIDSDDKFVTIDTYDKPMVDDSIHEHTEIVIDGKIVMADSKLIRTKHRNTIDNAEKYRALQINEDDEDINFDPLDQEESVDDEKDEPGLPRAVGPRDAKQQVKDRLKAATEAFVMPDLPKGPANDNYRPVVSWPLMGQLTRSTFEPNPERRTKFIVTARYIRELIDLVEADPSGADCDVRRYADGKVYFERGQTLDRKKRTYDTKNNEPGAERFDGSLRTAKKSTSVDNSVNRDLPFVVRVIAARQELDAIRQYIGSALWPLLVDAISENASMTDIGLKLGARGGQAPPVGSAVIRLALSAAIDALATLNWLSDDTVRPTPLPDKSRGSYMNQAKGPVVKLAA